ELPRSGAELPSRVADNLFWLGRYVERAEGTARLLRSILSRLADASGGGEPLELPTLAQALAVQSRVEPSFLVPDTSGSLSESESALLALMQEQSPARTLRATIAAAQRLGAVVRDQISSDTWRVLGQLDQALPHGRLGLGAALDGLNRLTLTLAAFSGLGVESMTRGQGPRLPQRGPPRPAPAPPPPPAAHPAGRPPRWDRPAARGAAGGGRRAHPLPPPLPGQPSARARPRPPAPRRDQPARPRLP